MAGQTFEYVQDALKDAYAEAIVNQVPKKSPLWAILEKKTAPFYGKRLVIPVQFSFPEAVGSRKGGSYTLPSAQRAGYDQAYVYAKKIYGKVSIDGLSIESAKGKGGWIDLLTNEIKSITNAFAIDVDRQLLCNGTGVLGVVDSIADQVITLKDAGGITGDTPVTKFFRKDMVIDIYTAGGTNHADSVVVSAIDSANGKITVTGTVTSVAQDDIILREDVFHATPEFIGDMMGIEGIVGTGNPVGSTFEGIDATAEPLWQSYVIGSVSTLSEQKIQEALDSIDSRTDGDPVNLAITTHALRNKLISLMQALRKIDTLDFKAGWKAVKYIGGAVELPFLVHPKCPTGYIYLLATDHIRLYELLPLTWDAKGGGMIKNTASEDIYMAWFKFYGNLGTDCRNAHGKMTGVTA